MSEGQPRRKRWFWRALLSLMLGLAAWSGISWLLSPTPRYVLHYPETGAVGPYGPRESLLDKLSIDMDGDHCLKVVRPNFPTQDQVTVERLELSTGRLMASVVYSTEQFYKSRKNPRMTGGYFLLIRGITVPLSSDLHPIGDGFHCLHAINNSRQSVCLNSFRYGKSVDEMIRDLPWVPQWMLRREVGIWDDDQERFLWRVPEYAGLDEHTTVLINNVGDHLIVDQSSNRRHEIYVLKLPLATVSPWWSRLAGIVVALAALWVLFRRRKSLQVA